MVLRLSICWSYDERESLGKRMDIPSIWSTCGNFVLSVVVEILLLDVAVETVVVDPILDQRRWDDVVEAIVDGVVVVILVVLVVFSSSVAVVLL